MSVWDKLGALYKKVPQKELDYNTNQNALNTPANAPDLVLKAVLPNFLYKPPFGYPIAKDIPELRRLAKTPYPMMVINTICDEVASLEWDIKAKEHNKIPDEIIFKTKKWFNNPNSNEESWEYILRTTVKDILEIDAGVMVKVFNKMGDFVELYTRDGGTITKNPDMFGVLPEKNAYYQYGWNVPRKPTPFNKSEIVYIMRNPRADSIYGYSPIETLHNVIQLLLYGIDSNLEHFSENMIPKGIMMLKDANNSQIQAFKRQFEEGMKKQDAAGNWQRKSHKMPILNVEGKFEKLEFSNLELDLINQQQWFVKILFSCFGVTPSEMGFTEDSKQATDKIQNIINKRKVIRPITKLLEYHINTQIINDLPWIKNTQYENKIEYFFDKSDLQETVTKREIIWGDVDRGLISVNEAREQMGLPTIEKKFSDEISEDDCDNYKKNEDMKSKLNKIKLSFDDLVEYKPLAYALEKELKNQKKIIVNGLKKQMNRPVVEIKNVEYKGIVDYLLNLFTLQNFKSVISTELKKNYFNGAEIIEQGLNQNISYSNEVSFIEEYTFDLIKNLENDVKEKIRIVIKRGLLGKKSYSEVAKEVRKVFDVSVVRSKSIAVTETNRAMNTGSYDSIVNSGRKGKIEWNAVNDGRTSDLCKALNGKQVNVGSKFSYKGESFLHPPAHSNCRSTFSFIPE